MSSDDQPINPLQRRQAGVLLHLTSLPGRGATGDLGIEAFRFVDFLRNCGFGIWQMLPIGPTQADGSPYQTSSAHAGNPRLIGIEPLVEAGWLDQIWLQRGPLSDAEKTGAIVQAWQAFREKNDTRQQRAYQDFVESNAYWLEDYALFRVLHEAYDHACWWQWPEPDRDRHPEALTQAGRRHSERIDFTRFEQFLFFSQWRALKSYANQKGVGLFGDMPIFVAHDSAEVWARREMFLLDETGQPTAVAGVPPDYFSETGQRWGNPLYDWDQMRADDFTFWVDRMQTQLHLFDLIRIDHFRGFEACWAIPAHEEHAINGQWIKTPGERLFERLHEIYDPLPLVAEDLGIITPEVTALREKFGLPGMKILQFAFSGDADNPYLPASHGENAIVYTGTHDNDTTVGWYNALDEQSRNYVEEVIGPFEEAMPWPLIRCAMASTAKMAIIPMQDLLALGSEHRMNIPGTTEGNWRWRFQWTQVEPELAPYLNAMIEQSHRNTQGVFG